jgi:hypothetical protein
LQDHVLAAEELKTGWLFTFHPHHQSHRITSTTTPPLVIWTMTGSPEKKESYNWPKIVQPTDHPVFSITVAEVTKGPL